MTFEELLAAALEQRRAAHPEWAEDTVTNVLRAAQRPMWGARSLEDIAAAWPRFAGEPTALLHAFPYKSAAWWKPSPARSDRRLETPVVAELEHDTTTKVSTPPPMSTTVVTMTSCAPIAPEDGIELAVDDFLDDDALGDLAAPAEFTTTNGPSPSAQLAQLVESERALAERRRALVIELVLDEGWNYAHVGRALGTSRQAAAKTYGPLVNAELRRRVTHGGAAAARK